MDARELEIKVAELLETDIPEVETYLDTQPENRSLRNEAALAVYAEIPGAPEYDKATGKPDGKNIKQKAPVFGFIVETVQALWNEVNGGSDYPEEAGYVE